ncbi:MAG: AraC family transcriptional regulator [Microscillaceae bacterium]|nr:AraC family transcriptional regulator [Microscillaceae bacterium]
MPHILRIKNMVCPRCIRVVQEELEKLRYEVLRIQLGEVQIAEENPDTDAIKQVLEAQGFELLEDRNAQWIEQVKNLIIHLVQNDQFGQLKQNLSTYLSEKTGKDYSFLSHLFSAVEGITIEKYLILQKIERAKELLIYDEETLSEIAFRLGYSSTAHLSGQFKQVTGQNPSEFKKQTGVRRRFLDEI